MECYSEREAIAEIERLQKLVPTEVTVSAMQDARSIYGLCECGWSVNDSEKYCSRCGAKLTFVVVEQA